MDYSLPGSSVHGDSPGKNTWGELPFSFSRGSSWPRDPTHVSCIGRQILYHWATWEAHIWFYWWLIFLMPFSRISLSYFNQQLPSSPLLPPVRIRAAVYWGLSRTQALCRLTNLSSQQARRMAVIIPSSGQAKWGFKCLASGLQSRARLQIHVCWHLPSSFYSMLSWQENINEKNKPQIIFCFVGISHNVCSGRGQKCWWGWVWAMNFNYLWKAQIIRITLVNSKWGIVIFFLTSQREKDLEWILHLIISNQIEMWASHPCGFCLFLWHGWKHCQISTW